MKKYYCILIYLIVCSLFLCACTNTTTAPVPVTKSAREELTNLEGILFDAVIELIEEEFNSPSSVRVLKIIDYMKDSEQEEGGPDTVIVYLQGITKSGYEDPRFIVCVKTGVNTSEFGQTMIHNSKLLCNWDVLLSYSAEEGDYAMHHSITFDNDASDDFSISRINRALTEYWEEMGF